MKKNIRGRKAIPGSVQSTFATVDQVADYLSLDKKTIYERVKANDLPGARHVGRSIRIHWQTFLESFLKKEQAPLVRQHDDRAEPKDEGEPGRSFGHDGDATTVTSLAAMICRESEERDRPSETESKGMIFRVHLLPSLGSLKIGDLDALEIDAYCTKKRNEGLAPATIRNHLIVLKKVLTVAQRLGLVRSVPPIPWPEIPAAKVDFPNSREAKRVADAAIGQWSVLMRTAAKTGMRPSELRALRASDVDLERGEVSIRRSAWRQHVGPTKGGRPRVVPLSPDTRRLLKKHLAQKGSRQLVFSGEGGEMLTRDQLKRPLVRACKKARTRQFSLGAFRHTYATELAKKKVALTAIQRLLGHRSVRTTLAYTHRPPDELRRAVSRLDKRRRSRGAGRKKRKSSVRRRRRGQKR